MIRALLDPMFDVRLTNGHMDYEVWHYVFELNRATCGDVQGLVFDDPRSRYDAGRTPHEAMTEIYSKAVMSAAIDNVPDLIRWINNNAQDLGAFGRFYQPGSQIKIGRDDKGWLMQFWMQNTCYGHMRFDPRAPAPPGWNKE